MCRESVEHQAGADGLAGQAGAGPAGRDRDAELGGRRTAAATSSACRG